MHTHGTGTVVRVRGLLLLRQHARGQGFGFVRRETGREEHADGADHVGLGVGLVHELVDVGCLLRLRLRLCLRLRGGSERTEQRGQWVWEFLGLGLERGGRGERLGEADRDLQVKSTYKK